MHNFTLNGAQKCSTYNERIKNGLGEPQSLKEYADRAQWVNYEGYRAIFESRSNYRNGILLWMSHPAWPCLVFQTYDYYFEPTAAYFGAKKACEPLHIQYNALTDSIEMVNHSAGNQTKINATATIFDLNGKRVSQKKTLVNSADDSTQTWLKLSELMPRVTTDVYFLRLQLSDKNGILSENLYIMGRKENDYRALSSLPKPMLHQQVKISGEQAEVILKNTGKTPAVFLRLNLKGEDNEQILPVVYSDNYLTLMPGEQRTVTITWKRQDARGQQPRIEITSL